MRRAWKPIVGLLLVALVGLGLVGVTRLNRFSEATSGKGLLTSDISERAGESDRFNLLVLGYGGKGHDGANLTDSILVYSVPLDGGPASQISIPRDMWVESPVGSGQYRKVNSVYAQALAETGNPRQAANVAAKSIGSALGVPIQGWMTVDFDGFRDLVNALGGVEVDVQRRFTARYPDPKRPLKWTNVKFEKGVQEMDGEKAIQYARARYVYNNPAEGSDFGRAARQQRLVAAIKSKLLSPAGLARGFSVADAVQDDILTNVSSGDLARLFRRGTDPKRAVVLSDQNVLIPGTSNDGQYILYPPEGDYTVVHRFVRDALSDRPAARR